MTGIERATYLVVNFQLYGCAGSFIPSKSTTKCSESGSIGGAGRPIPMESFSAMVFGSEKSARC